jgi:hypothetical protein
MAPITFVGLCMSPDALNGDLDGRLSSAKERYEHCGVNSIAEDSCLWI